MSTMLLALQRFGFQPPEDFVYTEIWGKKEVEVLTAVGVPEHYISQGWSGMDQAGRTTRGRNFLL